MKRSSKSEKHKIHGVFNASAHNEFTVNPISMGYSSGLIDRGNTEVTVKSSPRTLINRIIDGNGADNKLTSSQAKQKDDTYKHLAKISVSALDNPDEKASEKDLIALSESQFGNDVCRTQHVFLGDKELFTDKNQSDGALELLRQMDLKNSDIVSLSQVHQGLNSVVTNFTGTQFSLADSDNSMLTMAKQTYSDVRINDDGSISSHWEFPVFQSINPMESTSTVCHNSRDVTIPMDTTKVTMLDDGVYIEVGEDNVAIVEEKTKSKLKTITDESGRNFHALKVQPLMEVKLTTTFKQKKEGDSLRYSTDTEHEVKAYSPSVKYKGEDYYSVENTIAHSTANNKKFNKTSEKLEDIIGKRDLIADIKEQVLESFRDDLLKSLDYKLGTNEHIDAKIDILLKHIEDILDDKIIDELHTTIHAIDELDEDITYGDILTDTGEEVYANTDLRKEFSVEIKGIKKSIKHIEVFNKSTEIKNTSNFVGGTYKEETGTELKRESTEFDPLINPKLITTNRLNIQEGSGYSRRGMVDRVSANSFISEITTKHKHIAESTHTKRKGSGTGKAG